jgi:Raf kinase inhibitor-like YbhB/YbcL family protein
VISSHGSSPCQAWRSVALWAALVGCTRAEHAGEAHESATPAPATSALTPVSTAPPTPPTPHTPGAPSGAGATIAATLTVTSPAFAPRGAIPKPYTCDGKNVSLPLELEGVPTGAKSLAVIVEDPDAPDPAAPRTVWTHWVVYDLPAGTHTLAEGAGNHPGLGRPGKNDWGQTGYRGPCPPIGKHRYFVKAFALDVELGDLGGPTKAQLLDRMQGHVLGRGEMFGTYQKGG